MAKGWRNRPGGRSGRRHETWSTFGANDYGLLPGGGSALTFGTSVASTTVAVNSLPATAVGDLLLIWVNSHAASMTFSVTSGSTGWTAVTASTGQNFSAQLLYKNADSTDVSLAASGGTYTVTASVSHSISGVIADIPGGVFDPSAPTSSGQLLGAAATSFTVTGVTTSNSGDLLLLFGGSRWAGTNPIAFMTLPSGWVPFNQANYAAASASAGVGTILGVQVQQVAGATGSPVVSMPFAADGGGLLLAITLSAPAPTVPQLVTGAPDSASFQAVAKVTGASTCRLAYSVNSNMSSPSFTAGQAPDSLGYVRYTVGSLSSHTRYFCQVAATPSGGGSEVLVGPIGACKTLPPAGSAQSFTVAFVSCIAEQDVTTPPALDAAITDWIGYDADLNIFTGDFDYSGTTSTVTATQVGIYESQIANIPSLASMTQTRWGYYCRSDHEAGPDNGDSNNAYTATNIAAAQEVFPFGTLGDTTNTPVHGLYQAWVVGRVRFIMIDIRNTDRSPGANTDNSSKTMLGATQLAWLENQLIQSEPLKVIISDVAWMGPASITNGIDKWWSYDTERQAILSYIAANITQVQNVTLWHGDSHLVGATPGPNNTWGAFPVYCAAPMLNIGGGLNTSTFTNFYNNAGGECRLYGRVSITDNGTAITVSYLGWDAANAVAQVAQTDVFITSGIPDAAATALGPSTSLQVNAGLATASAAALSPTASVGANTGLATGTGAALSTSAAIASNTQVATGTGAALTGAAAISGTSGIATGTGSAQSPSPQLNPNAGLATGTGTALSPSGSVSPNSGLATGTGTALGPNVAIQVNAGLATGTGTALNPTVQTSGGVNANAGLATATGTALGPNVAIQVNAGLATGTGSALTAAVAISGTSGLATGTGSAQSPSPQVAPNAGIANGTGSALTASKAAGVNAGLATATGAPVQPNVSIGVPAGVATGTGGAGNAGHGAGIGLASAAAAALQPGSFAITFTATVAQAAAAALQPAVQAATAVVKGHVITAVTGKSNAATVTDTTEATTKVTGKSLSGSVT